MGRSVIVEVGNEAVVSTSENERVEGFAITGSGNCICKGRLANVADAAKAIVSTGEDDRTDGFAIRGSTKSLDNGR